MIVVYVISLLCWSFSLAETQYACSSELYCHGPLLDKIQRSQLFLDPKRFVDMPTRLPKSKVLDNFLRIKRDGDDISSKDLRDFLWENFHKAGRELRIVMPSDFKANVTALDDIRDGKLRNFGYEIHHKWKSLLRQVDKKLICKDCESTMLDLPFPFLVPGGRFREYYYWDTFWILEGIYVSEMCTTARSVIENTLWMAKEYGFVPNGSRTYYLNRSQPPMLPMMVGRFFEECGATLKKPEAFLERALPILELEYDFWRLKRSVVVNDGEGTEHSLNRYSAEMNTPRPESYLHDVKVAENMTTDESSRLYHHLASTTESGWDFSGRWLNWTGFANNSTMPGLNRSITANIVPVDLNAVLFRNELVISDLYGKIGQRSLSEKYKMMAEERVRAINSVLFSAELGIWKDYDWVSGQLTVDRPFYMTDICPLWYGPYKNLTLEVIEKILSNHEKILHGHVGGIPISEVQTGQQWDYPNVWAPTQYLAVKMYLRLHRQTGNGEYFGKALSIGQKWINSAYCGYSKYGYVFEKYHADNVGKPGGGGEYIVQEGFGWSNGVILWMLKHLGQNLTVPDACPHHSMTVHRDSDSDSDGDDDSGEVILDWLTVFVWIMTLLLSATFAVLIVARWRGRNPPEEPLLP